MDNKTFDALWGQFKQLHRKEELRQLVNLVEWFEPYTILELGVCHGGSFKMWEHILPKGGLLIGIDRLNVVQWDWHSSSKSVDYIQGDLNDTSTYLEVKKALGGMDLDFLYIDADHYYDGVKHHFELYSQFMCGEGIIAFHDIRDNKDSGYGVGKFFNELKEQYKWLEILVPGEDRGPGADGIGVIFK